MEVCASKQSGAVSADTSQFKQGNLKECHMTVVKDGELWERPEGSTTNCKHDSGTYVITW